ncbi:MAG TPA: NADPH-dependent F420 reductase [Burkholderiales bacterium]|nr:NADPH-dependent F420 reductase [Burkholderiales bacterium]
MHGNDSRTRARRAFLHSAAAALALGAFPGAVRAQGKLRIGVIGSGRVGGTIGTLWVKAGHQVMFSSLDLEHDRKLAASIGAGARAGTPKEAAAFGEVLFFAVPYSALPGLGRDLAAEIKGKIVLDASNPIPSRDGDMAKAALARGTGVSSPEFLPGTRLVRAYNEVGYVRMREDAHRSGERLGIPLAGDDAQALKTAAGLVRDAGHEPVIVGGLARAREFDYGTAVFGSPMTASELRKALNLKSQ